MLIELLQAEPSVSEAHKPTEQSRDLAVDSLTEIVARHFDPPSDFARAASEISFGLAAVAGSHLPHRKRDLKKLEDTIVSMILTSTTNPKNEFMLHRKGLERYSRDEFIATVGRVTSILGWLPLSANSSAAPAGKAKNLGQEPNSG